MIQKKTIGKPVPTDLPAAKKKPNIIKIIIIIIFLGFGIFLIKWNSKQINLEGNWTATKIIIDGEDILASDSIAKYFILTNQITIIRGKNQILISVDEKKRLANYIVKKNDIGKNCLQLSSKEKALNGNFEMKIDTIDLGPQEYLVKVKLHSKKTYIDFQKQVIIPPWKPELPRRGQV
jgi:hypothetical protein